MPAAILLIAHGSRRPEANADLVEVARQLSLRIPSQIVEISYLELAEPSIPAGLSKCVERGATSIRMLPYFLSAGAHVVDDLRAMQSEFLEKFPQVHCTLCPPLGLHPRIIDVLLDRVDEQLPDDGCASLGRQQAHWEGEGPSEPHSLGGRRSS